MELKKCKNKRCGVYDIIIEGKSYTFENQKPKFMMNRNLSCYSKNIVYIIHESNIKLPENRKLVRFEGTCEGQGLRARLCCRKISDSIFWLYYFTPR